MRKLNEMEGRLVNLIAVLEEKGVKQNLALTPRQIVVIFGALQHKMMMIEAGVLDGELDAKTCEMALAQGRELIEMLFDQSTLSGLDAMPPMPAVETIQ